MSLDRRDFLRTAAGAAALGLVPATLTASVDDADGGSPARPALVDSLGADAVRRIGARYRTLVPDERDARVLRSRLAVRPSAAAIADDFAAGRTVVVDGWILSPTEARQCALFSLRG